MQRLFKGYARRASVICSNSWMDCSLWCYNVRCVRSKFQWTPCGERPADIRFKVSSKIDGVRSSMTSLARLLHPYTPPPFSPLPLPPIAAWHPLRCKTGRAASPLLLAAAPPQSSSCLTGQQWTAVDSSSGQQRTAVQLWDRSGNIDEEKWNFGSVPDLVTVTPPVGSNVVIPCDSTVPWDQTSLFLVKCIQ